MWEITKDFFIQENGENIKVLSKGDIVTGSLISMTAGGFWLSVETKDNTVLLDSEYYKRFQLKGNEDLKRPSDVSMSVLDILMIKKAHRAALFVSIFFIILTIFYFIQKSHNNGRRKKGQ